MPLPTKTRSLIIRGAAKPSKHTYHDVAVVEKDIPALKQGEVVVKISAAGFNHRELWSRMGLYPGIVLGATLGADGAGTVVGAYENSDPLLQKRVFLTPARGWEKDPVAPESRFGILGGGSLPPIGTFSEYVVVERDQVIPTPAHLDDVQAAAWPLGGLTAWRATMVNARVERGHNVLITGVGGGVALLALQLCVAKGANVYVTSGTDEKIAKAVALGAKGGVKYKDEDWPQQLGKLLKRDGQVFLDSVVDSAGGDIMRHTLKLLKQGGKVVCYGMTAAPAITFRMPDVMRNVQLLGSTMGSRQDLLDATAFMEKHRIVPVVSKVLEGIDAAEEGFEIMKKGSQFGKIVVRMEGSKQAKQAKQAKL